MKKALILIGIVFSACTASLAQQEKGDISLTFGGTYIGVKDNKSGSFYAKAGYFITDNIEVGVRPNLTLGEGMTMFGFGGYGTYNFLTSDAKLAPYAGAELNFNTVSIEGLDGMSRTDMGLYAGSKYFLTESLNVDAGLNLGFNIGNNYGEGYEPGTVFMMQIGIGFILGKL
ncbi:MAG TPA: hypothetical protein VD884_04225 [Ohtaekwangia sp.]|nr:hypothetical protein [Ohtaekwangia sp.]